MKQNISIKMPMLSPEAAYALSEWLFELAQEVDLYYGDEIRSYRQEFDDDNNRCLREE